MGVLLLVVLYLFLPSVLGQLSSGGGLPSGSLNKLVVAESGRVFVLDEKSGGAVYMLSEDLSTVMMSPSNTSTTPRGIVLSVEEDRLVICWTPSTEENAFCTIHNSSTLTELARARLTPLGLNIRTPSTSSYSVSRGFVEGEETFFVATSGPDGSGANRLYHGEYQFSDGSAARDLDSPQIVSSSGFSRTYEGGTRVGNFVYLVGSDASISDAVRIVRLCDGSEWDSWYEVGLFCGQEATPILVDFDNALVSVNFLLIENGVDEPTLVVSVFSTDTGDTNICSFPISAIDSAANFTFTTCTSTTIDLSPIWTSELRQCELGDSIEFCDLEKSSPFGTRGPQRLSTENDLNPTAGPVQDENPLFQINGVTISSTTVFIVDDVTVIFIGTDMGEIRKFTTPNLTTPVSDTSMSEQTWKVSTKPVITLEYARGSNYVYGLTEDEVYRVPVEECSNFTDCSSCVMGGGRLCGWCTIENKCSRVSRCYNTSSPLRWVQENSECLSVTISSAVNISGNEKAYPRKTSVIEVIVANLPPLLSGESYQCVFDSVGSGNLTLISGDMYSCEVPDIPQFQQGMEDSMTVNFTLKSSVSGIDFGLVQDGVIFYDCTVHVNCTSCTGRFTCTWCGVDTECRTNGDTCTGMTSNVDPDMCPRFLPNDMSEDGRYYLHEGLTNPDVTLELTANNLVAPISGYSYECVIQRAGSPPVTLTLTVDNSSQSVACQINNPIDLLRQGESQVEVSIKLMWTNGSESFTIDQPQGALTVVLYDCSRLGIGCSSCLSVGSDFNCGYCNDLSDCVLRGQCGSGIFVVPPNFTLCGEPEVDSYTPESGPLEGGTLLTITGTNLGVLDGEGVIIKIGQNNCTINRTNSISGKKFICRVPPATAVGPTTVMIIRSLAGSNTEVGSFMYASPVIRGIYPVRGPTAGSTLIHISGSNLNIGNMERTTASVVGQVCMSLNLINTTHVSCTTIPSTEGEGSVSMNIDGNIYTGGNNVKFSYVVPRVTSLFDPDNSADGRIIKSGGVTVILNGNNLDAALVPQLTLQTGANFNIVNCTVRSSKVVACRVPIFTGVNASVQFNYSLGLDGETLSNLQDIESLEAVANPVFNPVSIDYVVGSGEQIVIEGENFLNVLQEDYNITVNGQPCTDLSITDTRIFCTPPASLNSQAGSTATVVVQLGDGAPMSIGDVDVQLNPIVIIVPAVVGGAVVISLLLVCCIVCCVCCQFKRKSKEKEKQVQNLLTHMELMESELADECRRAFTELQTDLELVYDRTDQHLPFNDFRSFAMRFLFPHCKDHVVLQPLQIPPHLERDEMMKNLDAFRQLIMHKKFLLCMVRSLESQQGKFTLVDRCNVASLLMVAFQNDLDYATQILIALLQELIQKTVTKNHPKLLLRRTESVAEKLLSNWLCFLLYPHVVEHVGEPLYVLFRAIKSQLEKGPIDVITGEARQSLNEEKLLRTSLDPKPIDAVIVADNGEFTIKLWDCDSISQVKEKILDAIYKNAPVSSRPQISEVDLEFLQTGDKGLILRDHDLSNVVEGNWRRINTLGHYHIADVSAAHKNDPKKPPPRFRLVERAKGALVSGKPVDTIGTIVANTSASPQQADIFADDSQRICHIVKQDESAGANGEARNAKIISEVFLTRLLSTKRILQSYVDDLFMSIFTIPRGKSLPKAIKYLFDFLDLQAAELSQNDPDVLHTWKTNSLPLRFWVNIIKNPEFVFDIHKSATVDGCLTVVAQAYIDGTSTSDLQYNKDTPSARLLYVNEVKAYKKRINDYYSNIQALPKTNEYEMSAYLKEMSQSQQMYFVSESALYELFKYSSKFSLDLIEALEEEGLTNLAQNFEQLKESLDPPPK